MSDGLTPEKCPDCGGELRFLEKNSFSGQVFREYWCAKCECVVTLGGETALWQLLHDANEANRTPAPDATSADKQPGRPWWKFWGT